jgi:hypothetical protein
MEHWWNDTDRGKLSMEHWWNDTDRGKLKCREKKLSQCLFLHHKAHIDWLRIELGPSRLQVDN